MDAADALGFSKMVGLPGMFCRARQEAARNQ
jgi:hypothetical protein